MLKLSFHRGALSGMKPSLSVLEGRSSNCVESASCGVRRSVIPECACGVDVIARQVKLLASVSNIAMKKKRKPPDGEPTTDLILSSHVGSNADLFPLILRLHVKPGSTVADVTYGKGVFWSKVPDGQYELLRTDIKTGTDCRALPYNSEVIDAVVLDPPYMEGATRNTAYRSGPRPFVDYYGLDKLDGEPNARYRGAIFGFYMVAALEAWRVLKPNGVLILKCQDEVCANKQRLTHVELINGLSSMFFCEDLFVLTRTNRPGVSRIKKQVHARKNHSYFLVFYKRRKP